MENMENLLTKIRENISKVMIGEESVITLLLSSFAAGGHVLLEDVPGTGKTVMAKSHGPKLRYRSTNKNIATVTKSGRIKGRSKGTCHIYVYAINGVSKKIKVTVK